MRPIKELLQLMLDNPQCFQYHPTGLCQWVYEMCNDALVNRVERDKVHAYIKQNRPNKYSSLGAFTHSHRNYYWKPGRIEPRIKWLNQHIKKLSDNERKC